MLPSQLQTPPLLLLPMLLLLLPPLLRPLMLLLCLWWVRLPELVLALLCSPLVLLP